MSNRVLVIAELYLGSSCFPLKKKKERKSTKVTCWNYSVIMEVSRTVTPVLSAEPLSVTSADVT